MSNASRDAGPGRSRGSPGETRIVSTGRLEAFSDGVIAVAATLLVLNIVVPSLKHDESLAHALVDQWQLYVAYAVSFITIGIIWINHHVMISRLRTADHAMMMLNLLLLASIAVLPFATSLMAAYLRKSHGQNLAAGGVLRRVPVDVGGIRLAEPADSVREGAPAAAGAQLCAAAPDLRQGDDGLIPYAIATALAVVSPYVTLAICGAVAAFYALPVASGANLELVRPPRRQHAAPVVPGDRVELVVAEPGSLERVQQLRHPRDVAERCRDRRAVEVRAERDVLDADPIGDVAGVLGDQLDRRVGVIGEVGAQERAREHDPDETARLPDRVELGIGQVARRRAQRVRRRVRRDDRPELEPREVPEPASLRWLTSTRIPSSAQRASRAPGRRASSPGPMSGEDGEMNGTP